MLSAMLVLLFLTLASASPAPQNPTPLPASWGVYLCPWPDFQDSPLVQSDCKWINWALMDSSMCIFSDDDLSVGPDPGVQCQLWETHSRENVCSGRASPVLEYPGQRDIKAWTLENMGAEVDWQGYRCWLKEPIVP